MPAVTRRPASDGEPAQSPGKSLAGAADPEADGRPLTQRLLQGLVGRACRKANLVEGVHVLRHSFCSHLAMKGVPARTIQALAGHASITTTQRYMHLSPRALEEGIRALEGAEFVAGRGNIVATAEADSGKSNG